MKHWTQTGSAACCLMLLALSGCEQKPSAEPTSTAKIAVLETYIQEVPVEENALQTRFGKLELARSEPEMPPDTLSLDGKPVFQQEAFYLSLHQYIKQNQRDIVLFGSNCGGTACPQNQFYFLLLDKSKDPEIRSEDDFTAYPDDLKLNVDGDRLLLDLGFQAGKHKVATLQGDQLSIQLENVAKSFLGEENCRWLYDEALSACRDYRDTDPTCQDPQASFAGYLMRGVAAVGEHPGFMADAFGRRCKIACESDKTVDYPTFAKEVCSK